jgi:hypothetical protein
MGEKEYLLVMFASISALMFVTGFILVINMVY